MIGTAISLPRSKLKRRCVRSTSNTITFAGKTYEISKLGKHLPLHKSYKLLSRKLFRDYSPFSAKRFQSCLSSRSKQSLPVFRKTVCAIKFTIRKYIRSNTVGKYNIWNRSLYYIFEKEKLSKLVG